MIHFAIVLVSWKVAGKTPENSFKFVVFVIPSEIRHQHAARVHVRTTFPSTKKKRLSICFGHQRLRP